MSDCIPWDGPISPKGYARTYDPVRKRSNVAVRVFWERERGPLPRGITLDHVCHDPLVCAGGPSDPHRRCVNLAHVVPASRGANAMRGNSVPARHARQVTCIRGHELRTYRTQGRVRRGCTQCNTEAKRRSRATS